MATKKGVWNLQQVRDKELQSLWSYATSGDAAKLFVWGQNEEGQLGLNEVTGVSKDSPVQLPGTTWMRIAKGGHKEKAMLAVKSDNTLWGWGDNQQGQLGQSNKTQYSSPVQIPGSTWAVVQMDNNNIFATKTDGTLWSWGNNTYGELGINNRTNYSSPKQIPGTTWPTSLNKISSNNYGALIIKTDGTLWTWGRNAEGQLGQNSPGPSYRSSPVQIPGSWSYVCNGSHREHIAAAINTDGELFTWGHNFAGVLGHNNQTKYSSPTQIPGTWNGLGGGNDNMFATKTDGTLWAWGNNSTGRLAQNDTTQRSSPTQVGSGTDWSAGGQSAAYFGAVAMTKTDGTLWTVGNGADHGLLAAGLGVGVKRSSPVQVPGTDWNTGYGSVTLTYGNGYALRSL